MDLPGGSGRQQPPMTPLPLARQGSVYSLTFDEFQTTLGGAGKDFGSMNMDELLRNIWMAEESHAIAAPAATTSAAAADHAAGAPIQRQGSLTLPRTLSQKTVDEVWRDMMCFGTPAAAASPPAQRPQTLGEITLEEFLVRAGMVREDMAAGPTVPPVPAALPQPPQPPMLFPQSNAFAPMVPPLSVGNGLMTGTAGQGGGGAATVVSQEEEPNERRIGKLCEYVARNPHQVPKITAYLEQRCYKELRNEQYGFAKVVVLIYRKLLVSCKEQI